MSRGEPAGPDETGEPTPEWTGFALNIGLKLASTFGLGLSLYNALVQRFGGGFRSVLGDIASTIGQAVRAATGLTTAELQLPPVLDDLPIVPASWHQGEPADRILAGVNVPVVLQGDTEPTDIPFFVNTIEDMTLEEILAEAEWLSEDAKQQSPRFAAELREQAAYLFFLAKRF